MMRVSSFLAILVALFPGFVGAARHGGTEAVVEPGGVGAITSSSEDLGDNNKPLTGEASGLDEHTEGADDPHLLYGSAADGSPKEEAEGPDKDGATVIDLAKSKVADAKEEITEATDPAESKFEDAKENGSEANDLDESKGADAEEPEGANESLPKAVGASEEAAADAGEGLQEAAGAATPAASDEDGEHDAQPDDVTLLPDNAGASSDKEADISTVFKGEIWQLTKDNFPDEIPDFDKLGEPTSAMDLEELNLDNAQWTKFGWHDYFAARWRGVLVVRESGTYKFATESDDGSKLYVNDVPVVDNDGLHGLKTVEGTMYLKAGVENRVRVEFFEKTGGATLRVKYAGPDTGGEVCDSEVSKPACQLELLKVQARLYSQDETFMPPAEYDHGTSQDSADALADNEADASPVFKGEIWQLNAENFPKTLENLDFDALSEEKHSIDLKELDLDNQAWENLGWKDYFAARWTGALVVKNKGMYKFITESDDGSRLFVNGAIVVDNDGLHPLEVKHGEIYLEAGVENQIRVEFFEKAGGATLRVKYEGPDTGGEGSKQLLKVHSRLQSPKADTSPVFKGEIWQLNAGNFPDKIQNLDFDALGEDKRSIDVEELNLDDQAWKKLHWNDYFAARWTGDLAVEKRGMYKFITESDDGSRLFVNGALVVDNDGLHALQAKHGEIYLEAGVVNQIRVEFFEKTGGAILRVKYAGPDTGGEGNEQLLKVHSRLQSPKASTSPVFKGEIWKLSSENFPRTIPDFDALGEDKSSIDLEELDLDDQAWTNLEWHDYFAARWTGALVVKEAGKYKFVTRSDDGSRLFVNGKLVVDNDGLHAIQEKDGEIYLEAEVENQIRVEFFEATGGAFLQVKYAGPDTGGEGNEQLLKVHSRLQLPPAPEEETTADDASAKDEVDERPPADDADSGPEATQKDASAKDEVDEHPPEADAEASAEDGHAGEDHNTPSEDHDASAKEEADENPPADDADSGAEATQEETTANDASAKGEVDENSPESDTHPSAEDGHAGEDQDTPSKHDIEKVLDKDDEETTAGDASAKDEVDENPPEADAEASAEDGAAGEDHDTPSKNDIEKVLDKDDGEDDDQTSRPDDTADAPGADEAEWRKGIAEEEDKMSGKSDPGEAQKDAWSHLKGKWKAEADAESEQPDKQQEEVSFSVSASLKHAKTLAQYHDKPLILTATLTSGDKVLGQKTEEVDILN